MVGATAVVVVGRVVVVDGTIEVSSVGVVGFAPADCASVCEDAKAGRASAAVATTAPPTASPARRRTRCCRSVDGVSCFRVGVKAASFRHPGGACREGRDVKVAGVVMKPQLLRNAFVISERRPPQGQPEAPKCCRKEPDAASDRATPL